MFQTKVVEKIKTHILYIYIYIYIYFFVNRSVVEIMWKNIIELGRPRMTIWRVYFACWIIRAIDTQYVMLIDFPRQEWLRERP